VSNNARELNLNVFESTTDNPLELIARVEIPLPSNLASPAEITTCATFLFFTPRNRYMPQSATIKKIINSEVTKVNEIMTSGPTINGMKITRVTKIRRFDTVLKYSILNIACLRLNSFNRQ
jgi:hypothetical protein